MLINRTTSCSIVGTYPKVNYYSMTTVMVVVFIYAYTAFYMSQILMNSKLIITLYYT